MTYMRNIPVMSPWMLASKTLGLAKLNVAVPLLPSRARVSLTSGTHFSSTPRINSILAIWSEVVCLGAVAAVLGRPMGAKAAARGAMVARMAVDFILDNQLL